MTKKPFGSYTPSANGGRSLDEAMSEIQREMDVRRRLFDKWVSEGRMSWVDAHDRLERLCTALKMLIAYSHLQSEESTPEQAPNSSPHALTPRESLDMQQEREPA